MIDADIRRPLIEARLQEAQIAEILECLLEVMPG